MPGDARSPRRSPVVEELFGRLGRDVVAVEATIDPAVRVPGPEPIEASAVQRARPRRQLEFAVGRWCARVALGGLGAAPGPIPVGRGRAPVWPGGIAGSITHTAAACLAVVARAGGDALGVDAEVVGRVSTEVAGVVFDRDERDRFAAALDPDLAATVGFAAKEAFYKAQFPVTGSWVDFDAVAATVDERGPDGIGVVELAPVGDVDVVGRWAAPFRGAWTEVQWAGDRIAIVAVVTHPTASGESVGRRA